MEVIPPPLLVQPLEYQTVESSWRPMVRAIAAMFFADALASAGYTIYYAAYNEGWRTFFMNWQVSLRIGNMLLAIISLCCIYSAIRLYRFKPNAAMLATGCAVAEIVAHVVSHVTTIYWYFSHGSIPRSTLTLLFVGSFTATAREVIIPAMVIWFARREEVRRIFA